MSEMSSDACAPLPSALIETLYAELRELAGARMAQLAPGQTLQPTALVHEVFLRLAERDAALSHNRRHVFFAAARSMRDILVELARHKATAKAGGDHQRIVARLDALTDGIDPTLIGDDLLALDAALADFEAAHPAHVHVIMLRYFAGLTADETASTLQTSRSSVERSWRFARAWLRRALSAPGEAPREASPDV